MTNVKDERWDGQEKESKNSRIKTCFLRILAPGTRKILVDRRITCHSHPRFPVRSAKERHSTSIIQKYGDLPLAIEVKTEKMRGASLDNLKRIFRDAALRALIHAGEKHGRPVELLKSITTA
jgi:hypothetical protein